MTTTTAADIQRHTHKDRVLLPDTCARCAALILHRDELLDRADARDTERFNRIAASAFARLDKNLGASHE